MAGDMGKGVDMVVSVLPQTAASVSRGGVDGINVQHSSRVG